MDELVSNRKKKRCQARNYDKFAKTIPDNYLKKVFEEDGKQLNKND